MLFEWYADRITQIPTAGKPVSKSLILLGSNPQFHEVKLLHAHHITIQSFPRITSMRQPADGSTCAFAYAKEKCAASTQRWKINFYYACRRLARPSILPISPHSSLCRGASCARLWEYTLMIMAARKKSRCGFRKMNKNALWPTLNIPFIHILRVDSHLNKRKT